ncbi:hypothetical protein ACFTWD_02380 [Streptomyces sp. NPDC056943]|uniref:hypothetical protein n=1 Tax=Streptomyces sp. NPDC056943 TaxID=3345971 RepID=UPI00363223B0
MSPADRGVAPSLNMLGQTGPGPFGSEGGDKAYASLYAFGNGEAEYDQSPSAACSGTLTRDLFTATVQPVRLAG